MIVTLICNLTFNGFQGAVALYSDPEEAEQ
jgi:hypothetical protein